MQAYGTRVHSASNYSTRVPGTLLACSIGPILPAVVPDLPGTMQAGIFYTDNILFGLQHTAYKSKALSRPHFDPNPNPSLLRQLKCQQMTQFSSGCLQVLHGQRQKGPNWVLQTLGSSFQRKHL